MAKTKTDTKETILGSARSVFAQKGYDGARVEDIAREAHVTKALIYYYFSSKEEMLQTLFETFYHETLQLRERLGESLSAKRPDEASIPTKESFQKVIEEVAKFLEQRKDVINIMLIQALKDTPRQNPLLLYMDSVMQTELKAYQQRAGRKAKNRDEVMLQSFYMGFLPLVFFIVFQEKWCDYYGRKREAMRDSFFSLFYQEYFVDTLTRLFE